MKKFEMKSPTEENDIIITNNFLPKEQFKVVRDIIIGPTFAWYFNPIKVNENEDRSISPGQFTHMIYEKDVPYSEFYQSHFIPILGQLVVAILGRIKMNLNPRLPEPFYSDFHIDVNDPNLATLMTTSIFYINTNNGYTEFEEGTKVESVANRLVTFPANTRHRGVSQTDEQTKIVINFNYLKGNT